MRCCSTVRARASRPSSAGRATTRSTLISGSRRRRRPRRRRRRPPRATPSTKPTPGHAQPPKKPAFSPKKKLRIWVAGDSLVITPGYAIVRAAGSSPAMEPVGTVDGRIATGLTRPDVFNWFDEIRRQVKELHPKVVVLAFGGNDDKAYMTGLPDGTSVGDFGSWAWRKEYGRRVGGVMDTINRAGGFVDLDRPPADELAGPDAALRRRQRGRGEAGAQASRARGLRRHLHDVRRRRRRLRAVPAGRRRAGSRRCAPTTASTSSAPAAT